MGRKSISEVIGTIGDLNSCKGALLLPHLNILNLSNNKISDIIGIHSFSCSITEINLSQNNIKDLDGLGYLPNLKTLHLSSNNISSLVAIRVLAIYPLLTEISL